MSCLVVSSQHATTEPLIQEAQHAQILMSVPLTHAKTVVPALTKSTITVALAFRDGQEMIVKLTLLVAHLTLTDAMEMLTPLAALMLSILACALVQLGIQGLPASPIRSLLKDAQISMNVLIIPA
jgi:hypothetical protein